LALAKGGCLEASGKKEGEPNMGDLFDEVLREQTPRRKNQLDAIIESLNSDDLRDFLALLEDTKVSATALTRVMQKRGFNCVMQKRGFNLHRHAIMDYRNGAFRYQIEGTDHGSA
jgi:hypothetical protein